MRCRREGVDAGGAVVIPAGFLPFFTASAGAAGALIGLLFTAISIAPERIVGKTASPERSALAGNAFTALTNIFFITLVALVPAPTLGSVLTAAGVMAVVSTIRLANHLFAGRWRGKGRLSAIQFARRLVLVVASLAIYGSEVLLGVRVLAGNVGPDSAFAATCFFIVGGYSLALVRMWSLLGARKDSFFAWLSIVNEIDE